MQKLKVFWVYFSSGFKLLLFYITNWQYPSSDFTTKRIMYVRTIEYSFVILELICRHSQPHMKPRASLDFWSEKVSECEPCVWIASDIIFLTTM